jgi:ribosomal protein L11 methyltransferase
MTEARYTVTFGALLHDQALALASQLEDDFRLDPLAVTINETDEVLGLWETVLYFATDAQCDQAVVAYPSHDGVVAAVPQADWVRQSLEGLPPVVAGRFFLYGSHDADKRRAGGVSMEMDAGTAFGTGHHGTTAGCLLAIDRLLKRGAPRKAFDLGCGTGVLGIAVALASKRRVLATDIDPEAVRVTRNNAIRSGIRNHITAVTAPGLHHTVIHRGAPYDLIIANILARPLANMAHGICALLSPGGMLILSGITRDQQRWIIACYRNCGLVCIEARHIGNWVTLVMQRPRHTKSTARKRAGQLSARLGPGWEEA